MTADIAQDEASLILNRPFLRLDAPFGDAEKVLMLENHVHVLFFTRCQVGERV
jgi:hypothetical protein